MGNFTSAGKGNKLDSHSDDGYMRTGSQDELYQMGNLGGEIDERKICVNTQVVVRDEDAGRLPRTNFRKRGF
jgi:hypothetical protein